MAMPTSLSAKATALDSSRKHDHVPPCDAQHSKNASAKDKNNAQPESQQSQQSLTSDDDEDDDESFYGGILDGYELEPYVNDGSLDIDEREITALLDCLREKGPDEFFKEAIDVRGYPPRVVGIAFGIDPGLACDDDVFNRLLSHAVLRVFYKRRKLPQYNTVDDAARLIKEGQKIIVITGAGISTSLGIPDFRSKGTGFYDKVAARGYSEPQDVFDIIEFDRNPTLFYDLAGDILPDQRLGVTPTHAFIELLQDKGQLRRNYTQNIDDLESLAGLSRDRVIQCHGSFATATCRKCKAKVDGKAIFPDIRAQRVAHCQKCVQDLKNAKPAPKSKPQRRRFDSDDEDEDDNIPQPGVMKPDITFFGEQLPDTFFDRFTKEDAKDTDLVIVIGTSLKVAPVSEMPNYLDHRTPHIYISMEPIKHVEFDIQLLGKCDDVVVELCRRAGWDLEHHKISKDALEVCQEAEQPCGHVWKVQPAGTKALEEVKIVSGVTNARADGEPEFKKHELFPRAEVLSGGEARKKRPASTLMVSDRSKKVIEVVDLSD